MYYRIYDPERKEFADTKLYSSQIKALNALNTRKTLARRLTAPQNIVRVTNYVNRLKIVKVKLERV